MIWYYHENERESREKIKKIVTTQVGTEAQSTKGTK